MLGADYSSKLSPWLANGCISPRHVAAECAKYEATRVKNKSTYWLVFELLWRDFFRQYTEKHGANVFKVEGPARAKRPWRDDPEMLRRWKEGARYIELLIASSAIGVDSTWIRDTVRFAFIRNYYSILLQVNSACLWSTQTCASSPPPGSCPTAAVRLSHRTSRST